MGKNQNKNNRRKSSASSNSRKGDARGYATGNSTARGSAPRGEAKGAENPLANNLFHANKYDNNMRIALSEERLTEIETLLGMSCFQKSKINYLLESQTEQKFLLSKRFSKKIEDLYLGLIALNFTNQQAESALKYSSIQTSSTTEEALGKCLDWLCSHIKAEDLPAIFSSLELKADSVSKTTEPVVVLQPTKIKTQSKRPKDCPEEATASIIPITEDQSQTANDMQQEPAPKSENVTSEKEASVITPAVDLSSVRVYNNGDGKKSKEVIGKSWILSRYDHDDDEEEEDAWDLKQGAGDDLMASLMGRAPRLAAASAAATPWAGLEGGARLRCLLDEFEASKRQQRSSVAAGMVTREEKAAQGQRMATMRREIEELQAAGVAPDPTDAPAAPDAASPAPVPMPGAGVGAGAGLAAAVLHDEIDDTGTNEERVACDDANIGNDDAGDDEISCFGMFDEEAAAAKDTPNLSVQQAPSISTNTSNDKLIPKTCLDKWTGKTPKTLLNELCQKQRLGKVVYTRLQGGSHNGARCTVKGSGGGGGGGQQQEGGDRVFAWGNAERYADAQHGAATRALYALAPPAAPLYRLLPPFFKSIWLNWQQEEEKEKASIAEAEQSTEEQKMKAIIAAVRKEREALLLQKLNTIPGELNDAKHPAQSECQQEVEEEQENCLASWEEFAGPSDDEAEEVVQPPNINDGTQSHSAQCSVDFASRLQKVLIKREDAEQASPLQSTRKELPIAQHKEGILNSLQSSNVVVVSGDTGCGKTTQVPQFILEQWAAAAAPAARGGRRGGREGPPDSPPPPPLVLCAQPRRIAALGVADRVAEEIGCPEAVGYQIRLQTNKTRNTRILFCTNGILLRMLQDDPTLSTMSHVIIDEAHERQADADLLLASLRRLLRARPRGLKVILMSATLNAELFCNYFGGCPLFTVPGRTFPVENIYIEDILETTGYVFTDGPYYSNRAAVKSGSTNVSITGKGGKKYQQTISWEQQSSNCIAEEVEFENAMREELPGYSDNTIRAVMGIDELHVYTDLLETTLEWLICGAGHGSGQEGSTISPCLTGAAATLSEGGAILVFLPGVGEIRTLHDRLTANPIFSRNNECLILPLHSSLSPAEQKRVFKRPPAGITKIILSTNIAETSVTIDDVTVVIDTGIERQVSHLGGGSGGGGATRLAKVLCARASARQRAGRAGRTAPGVALRLFSKYTYNVSMPEFAKPEMLRIPLEEVCLQVISSGHNDCMSFLLETPSPPTQSKIKASLSALRDFGAIEALDEGADGAEGGGPGGRRRRGAAEEEEDGGGGGFPSSSSSSPSPAVPLGAHVPGAAAAAAAGAEDQGSDRARWALSPLGRHLARLPVGLRVGRMLVHAAVFRCIDPVLTIAAMLELKSPLVRPMGKEGQADARHLQFVEQGSDFLTLLNIFEAYEGVLKRDGRGAARDFCGAHFLSAAVLEEARGQREQLRAILAATGLLGSGGGGGRGGGGGGRGEAAAGRRGSSNRGSGVRPLVLAVLAAGLYPNVLRVERDAPMAAERGCYHRSEKVAVDAASTNHKLHEQGRGRRWLVFHEKLRTNRTFVPRTSAVPPAALLLFGGAARVEHTRRRAVVDGWIELEECPAKVAVLLLGLKAALKSYLDVLVEESYNQQGQAGNGSRKEGAAVVGEKNDGSGKQPSSSWAQEIKESGLVETVIKVFEDEQSRFHSVSSSSSELSSRMRRT